MTPSAMMEAIGRRTGIESWDAYARSGLILDCHLTGKLSWDDARSWAKELHADEVLRLLEGIYRPMEWNMMQCALDSAAPKA